MKRRADSVGASSSRNIRSTFHSVGTSAQRARVVVVRKNNTTRKTKTATTSIAANQEPSHKPECLETPQIPVMLHEIDNASTDDEWVDDRGNDGEASYQPKPTTVVQIQGGSRKGRKKANNADKLAQWLPYRDIVLDELLRHEGQIDLEGIKSCWDCSMTLSLEGTVSEDDVSLPYRCQDCTDGLKFRCKSCMRIMHVNLPFHRILAWESGHLTKSSTREIGVCVQLGHDGGDCSTPSSQANLLVIHSSGVFNLSVSYCQCPNTASKQIQLLRARLFPSSIKRARTAFTFEVLEMFHQLNGQSKTTLYDYYYTLLRQTDFLQFEKQPSQLGNLGLMMRLWRNVTNAKRAGRGHDPEGISGTKQGELMVECPACPLPGKNLPDNWKEATDLAFLYTIFLAVDANFKLKGKDRGLDDIEIDPGWGAFVEENTYQAYISQYIEQPEINTCDSEHDAVVRAAVRCTPGYSVTGAGLVICSRHCLIRPNGAGDLQKGERYCNMDYIVFSSMVGLGLLRVVLTYDIACQWSRKYRARMENLPEALQVPEDVQVEVAIPSWHINGHGKKCQEEMHVGYLNGVGRLCGDEVEQTWWNTNSLGTSVREMGPAARHQSLNEHWNMHNIRKIIGFRKRFAKNLKEAVAMRDIQTKNFEGFNASFSKADVLRWEKMVVDWENDKSKPNPYKEKETSTTLQQARLKLADEEAQSVTESEPGQTRVSMTAFLMGGLDIEEQQRVLQEEVKALPKKPTPKQQADLKEKQTSYHRRLLAWRETQRVYTPVVTTLLAPSTEEPNASAPTAGGVEPTPDTATPSVEQIPIYLPSSIPSHHRHSINRIANAEATLREGQAEDALAEICRLRRVLVGLTTFKKYNLGGEGNNVNTRMRGVYKRITLRIDRAASRYRAARTALMELDPNGAWSSRLMVLNAGDIRGPGRDPESTSRGRDTISWIWLARRGEASEAMEEEVDDNLRVDWAKSRARMKRWKEEVLLIQEEMRRVVAYLWWKARWWLSQSSRRKGRVGADIELGITAYSTKQASNCLRLANSCLTSWMPVLKALKLSRVWCKLYNIPTAGKSRAGPASKARGEGEHEDSTTSADGSDSDSELGVEYPSIEERLGLGD